MDVMEFGFVVFVLLISRRHFMSYASALLAMYSGHNPLSSKGLGSRNGIIHPDGLHFTKGYMVESKRSSIMKLIEMGFG
ncbi:hypothetical protein GGI43DRAFT_276497 [Trichoderma evansii]